MRRFAQLLVLLALASLAPVASALWEGKSPRADWPLQERVSLGFAAQDLRSPISQFGHSFLVFHRDPDPELDAISFEFSTRLDGIRDYLAAGFGGADGSYGFRFLENKLRDYELEDRNVWFYEITLSAEERERLESGVRYLVGTHASYGITGQNCASRVVRVLAQALGEPYRSESPFFVTPDATVRWLQATGRIKARRIHWSRQQLALHYAAQLTDAELHRDEPIALDPDAALDPPTRPAEAGFLSAAADRQILREDDPARRNAWFRRKQLLAGAAPEPGDAPDPAGRSRSQEVGVTAAGHGTGVAGAGQGSTGGIGLDLHPGFLRWESSSLAGFPGATSEFLSLQGWVGQGASRLERFTLARVESFVPAAPLRDPFSVLIDASYQDHRRLLPDAGRAGRVEFGRGWSWGLSRETLVFSLLPSAQLLAQAQATGVAAGVVLRPAMHARAEIRTGGAWGAYVEQEEGIGGRLALRARTEARLMRRWSPALGTELAFTRLRAGDGRSAGQAALRCFYDF